METIKLDLIPGKKMPSLHASQYDDGRDYHIDLTENRVPYTLDGTETISLTVRKCDNTLVTTDIANTFADKSYIEFRTTEQMNACAGFNYGEITIEKNGTQISSLNFYLQVEGAPDEGGITSQSEINNLNRQIDDHLDEVLPEKVEDIAPAIVEEVAPTVVREVAPSVVEDVAPAILDRLAPSAVESVAPSIVERLVPAEVAEVAPSVVRDEVPPIVERLVPEVVGDNYYNKEQTDTKIHEAVGDNYYTKTETDDLLDAKADKSTTYTKTQIDSALALKANASDVYTKSQADDLLDDKADKSTTYTKTETDALLALKADKSELYNVLPTEQANGTIANFTDGADNIPVKSLVSQIVATGGGGTPDAPIAINGFDSGIITRCGKNWLNNPDITIMGGSYVINNVNAPMVAGQYVLSFDFSGTSNSSSLRIDDENGTAIFTTTKTITSGHNEYLLNLPSKASFVKLYSNAVGTYSKFQIERGNQFTNFEAYQGNTYTFQFGQTVYGGHFDNKGNLVVTHSVVDLGDFNWLYFSSANKMIYGSFPQAKKPTSTTQKANILCEIFETISRAEAGYAPPYTKTGIGIDTSGNLFIQAPNSTWTDVPSAVTEITGYKLVYELATPITLSITSQDIPTALGENAIFSDTGAVDVTIHADIGLYIDKRLNTTRSTPTLSLSKDNSTLSETQVKYEDSIEESEDNNEER